MINKLTEAISNVTNKNLLNMSDILDEDDNVVGKFTLAYSDSGHPFIIAVQEGIMSITDVSGMKVLVIAEKEGGHYNFPMNKLDVPKSRLVDVYKHLTMKTTYVRQIF